LIPDIIGVILILGMCVQNGVRIFVFLSFSALIAVFFGGCEAMDAMLPSAGTYKINVQINGIPLDDCSYAKQSDKINPYFMEPVSNDPDITALMVFLRDSKEEIVGWKVLYNIDPEAVEIKQPQSKPQPQSQPQPQPQPESEAESDEEAEEDEAGETADDTVAAEIAEAEYKIDIPEDYRNGDELIVPVLTLDEELPSFPIPQNLPIGKYTMVSQVMSGKDVLQRTEKTFFYLGNTVFSYKGINAYLPGIADSLQLIPKGTIVLLETDLEFDKRFDPYIIWYDGKNKINEGNYSKGAGQFFWETPEQSGFFSLRADVFPHGYSGELAGYQKEISLLVSAKEINIHLISENISQLQQWYKFEAGLRDSKTPSSAEKVLKQTAGKTLKWMGASGTYGLASGYNNVFSLPKINFTGKDNEWQILFRLNSVNQGGIFSVLFDSNVRMHFYIEGSSLILILTSPVSTVSQTISLLALSEETPENEFAVNPDPVFITAGVSFSVLPGLLKAQINLAGDIKGGETAYKPVFLEAEIKNEFQIMLGFLKESLSARQKLSAVESNSSSEQEKEGSPQEVTAIWDELALYHMPPMEILAREIKPAMNEEQQIADAES